ncbi:MAG: recombination mediator RecR [Bacteroidia bacterium]|jgi:recombination protein RecR
MNYPSRLIEDAVNAFSRFPGIGKKTALRLTLHLLRQEEGEALQLAEAVSRLATKITYCKKCNNISDASLCQICSNGSRNQSLVCVVADMRDVIAIEQTGQYHGLYHVLGGLIAPMDGVGPEQLKIDSLLERLALGEVGEVLLAFSATMEGDTTAFYLARKLQNWPEVKISTIARGIAIGGELEYADEITLGRSIQQRIPFQSFGG